MRILLAEDDFVTRKFMMNFLSSYGECDAAVDGMEAVDAYLMALEDGEPYDLACLDIMMPVMDGYAATRAIRALDDPAIANVPIIAMTANAFDEDMHAAMKSGMNGYLSKPLDVDKLYAMMRKCLK